MGNQQSVERKWKKRDMLTNGKVFKITKKFTSEELSKEFSKYSDSSSEIVLKELKNEGRIHYFLDHTKGNLSFSIKCVNRVPFNTYQVGDYVKVRLLRNVNHLIESDVFSVEEIFSNHVFDDSDEIVKVEGAWEDSEGNIRDSSGSLSGEGGFQGNITEIGESREMLARANEWSNFDKGMQRAWQLQPPKK